MRRYGGNGLFRLALQIQQKPFHRITIPLQRGGRIARRYAIEPLLKIDLDAVNVQAVAVDFLRNVIEDFPQLGGGQHALSGLTFDPLQFDGDLQSRIAVGGLGGSF